MALQERWLMACTYFWLDILITLLNYFFYSSWSRASDEELEQAQLEWKRRQKEGTTHEVFEERNKMIKRIGETTTVVAYK